MLKPFTRSFMMAATLAAAAFSSGALALDKVTYQLDWLPGGDKSPLYVGIQEGFFKEEGLEVTISSGRGSTDAITKIATGQSDIGSADIGAVMAARVQDPTLPVKVVFTIYNQAPHAFFTLKGSGIESVSDIEGKRVATSPFTSTNAFLPLVLRENGLPEDAVRLNRTDPGALGPMLMNGGTDAIIAWVTNIALFGAQASAVGKEMVVIPWSEAGLELYSSSVVASERFLSERPEVAARFIRAFAKSVEFTNDNPQGAAAALHAMVPEVDPEVAAAQILDTMKLVFNEVTEADGLGALTPERVALTWEWVAQAEGLEQSVLDPETVVDRSLLEALN